jgi:hypothetical protein
LSLPAAANAAQMFHYIQSRIWRNACSLALIGRGQTVAPTIDLIHIIVSDNPVYSGRNRLVAERHRSFGKTRESELHKSFGIFGIAEYVSATFINPLPFGSQEKKGINIFASA